jgi:4-amino-4-deoxy-L-arabinose transferase-like glycosyltransferase
VPPIVRLRATVSGKRKIWLSIVGVLIVLRLTFFLLPGTAPYPAWSGGGDTERYVTLAENVLAGRGLTYSDRPTAFRSPAYVAVLAGAMYVTPDAWPLTVRLLQFLAGLGTALLMAWAGHRAWGADKTLSTAFVLACPTLIYVTSTIHTEALGSLVLASYFLTCLATLKSDRLSAWGFASGALLGLATLFRWAAPALAPVSLFALWKRKSLGGALWFAVGSLLVLGPWVARNWIVFGQPRLSTFGSLSLVAGLLDPQGRTQPGTSERMVAALGWNLSDYERNDRDPSLPDETEAERHAFRVWRKLIEQERLAHLVALQVHKLGWYWLSTEMLSNTQSLSSTVRLARTVMVGIWWGYLVLAGVGFAALLHRKETNLATVLGLWFLLATLSHWPFCMNTRLRIPFVDAPLALLAAYGFERAGHFRLRRSSQV